MKHTYNATTASAPETRTFTHVNTGKPAGIRETQNEQDNREARTIPAEKPTAIKTQDDWLNAYVKLEAQRNEAQAQSAQLAEALRIVRTQIKETAVREMVQKAVDEALAAWEKAKQ